MSFKENDIRPADLMKLKEPALLHDKQFLRDRQAQFVIVNCPACGSNGYAQWASKDGFEYSQCAECATIFMNPRASQRLLIEFYQQSKNYEFWNNYIFPASDKVRKEKIFQPRAKRVIEFANKYGITGGVLLEVGAAFGTFCEAIKEFNVFSRIIAVEPTPALAATCRHKGIETFELPIEDVALPPESVDIIANFEVIEHLFDPYHFLNDCLGYLKPNGLFICTCPNGLGLGTLVLKENAKVIDHEHVNYFNPRSLSILLERVGIDVVEVLTPGELDVELLINALNEQPALFAEKDFVRYLLQADGNVRKNFQEFIKENLLSSHLWIIGKKQ